MPPALAAAIPAVIATITPTAAGAAGLTATQSALLSGGLLGADMLGTAASGFGAPSIPKLPRVAAPASISGSTSSPAPPDLSQVGGGGIAPSFGAGSTSSGSVAGTGGDQSAMREAVMQALASITGGGGDGGDPFAAFGGFGG